MKTDRVLKEMAKERWYQGNLVSILSSLLVVSWIDPLWLKYLVFVFLSSIFDFVFEWIRLTYIDKKAEKHRSMNIKSVPLKTDKTYTWHEGMSLEDTKNLAYFERNMLALYLAKTTYGGWYYDTDNNWDGWKRVISIDSGRITFHIPDDFNVGSLLEIKPNWNGHSTDEKWRYVMKECGIDE